MSNQRTTARGWSATVVMAVLLAWPEAGLAQRKGPKTPPQGKSLVTIEVARNQYDYTQPWSRRTRRMKKTGIVVGDHQILTTADQMYDRTLVRLQKGGRGQWWVGDVAWIDYHANLALVTTSEQAFWEGLKPADFSSATPKDGNLQVVRWNDGNLENRRADFLQFTAREGVLSPITHVMLEVSSDIQGAGWGEPVVAGSKVLGMLMAQEGRTCAAIPAKFIKSILDARQQNRYRGLGFFHFYWMQAENPAALASLKLPGPPRGVIVISVPDRPDGGANVLKPKDVILQIDGLDLDIQGDYADPDYGHLMLESLATHGKWAGDSFKMKIWRDGREMEVAYQLPKFDYGSALVPRATFDKEPEFLLVGGLVFQPLTEPFLQSWGTDWKKRAPFRLVHYRNDSPSKDRPALVLLSQVLPDPYNIGYQDLRYMVLNTVNGQRVSRLRDLVGALAKPQGGYHIIEFVQSDSLRRMVLDAGAPEQQATARVLKRYGIPEPAKLSP